MLTCPRCSYKVYWANGSQVRGSPAHASGSSPALQIIDPHDEGIATSILANTEPWQKYDLSTVRDNELVVDPRPELGKQYLQTIADTLCLHREDNAVSACPRADPALAYLTCVCRPATCPSPTPPCTAWARSGC